MNNNDPTKKARKSIYIESLFIVIAALTPFLFKVYDYFPGPSHPEAHLPVSILGIEIGSNGFDSISTNIWFYTQKLVPLILFIFWFFTAKNWWYHILIIPIATYAFQMFELLFSEDDNIDTENIWWLIPVCMVVIPFVYLIRIKLYEKYVHGIDLEAMEAELKVLKEKANYKPTTDEELERLKNQTLSEYINRKLSTRRLEALFQQFQHNLKNWLKPKF